MRSYIERVVTDREVIGDVKTLIPDASLRRRMSRVVKTGVSTAVETLGGVEKIDQVDAIITATGFGCLADSEKFLRNLIAQDEQLLNPTPFIQSTFNTVGGQVALLRHNHCYNVTYVNRSHSFEDALLDAMMRIDDGVSAKVLVGAFDEQTEAQSAIMNRMGAFRKAAAGEGCVFTLLSAEPGNASVARIDAIDFPAGKISEDECRRRYASSGNAVVLLNDGGGFGIYPTASAMNFAKGVHLIENGSADEVILCNTLFNEPSTIVVLKCLD